MDKTCKNRALAAATALFAFYGAMSAALTANAGDIYWNGGHGTAAEPLNINDSQYWSGTPAWNNNMRFSDASGQTTYLTNTLGLAGWVCEILDFKKGDYSFSGDLFVSHIANEGANKRASVVKNGTWKIEKGFGFPMRREHPSCSRTKAEMLLVGLLGMNRLSATGTTLIAR